MAYLKKSERQPKGPETPQVVAVIDVDIETLFNVCK